MQRKPTASNSLSATIRRRIVLHAPRANKTVTQVTSPPRLAEARMTYHMPSATTGHIASPTIDWSTITHTTAPTFASTSTSTITPSPDYSPSVDFYLIALVLLFGCLLMMSGFVAYSLRYNRNETLARAVQDRNMEWERNLDRKTRRAVMKQMRKLQKQVDASQVLAHRRRQSLVTKCRQLGEGQTQLLEHFKTLKEAQDKTTQSLLGREEKSQDNREADKLAISQADTKAEDLSKALKKLQSEYADMRESNQTMIEKLDTKADELEVLEKAHGKTTVSLDRANKTLITLQTSAKDNVDDKGAMQKQIDQLQTSVKAVIDEKAGLQEQMAKLQGDLQTANAAVNDTSTQLEVAKKFRENQRKVDVDFNDSLETINGNLQVVQNGLKSWAEAHEELVKPALASLQDLSVAQKTYNEDTSKNLDELSQDFHGHSSKTELAILACQQTQVSHGTRIEEIDKAQKLDHRDMACRGGWRQEQAQPVREEDRVTSCAQYHCY